MKKLIALYVLCTSYALFGQTKFEKGYFITTKGNKVECLIKNEDWIGIPDRIEYKVDASSTVNSMEKENLTKVHIVDKILLERHEVLIERYSKNLDELSNSRLINPKKESLLLKVIADGKAKLLKYDFKGVQYFFYELNSNISSLEYKLYKTSKGTLGKNLNYQKTLREKLSCPNKNLKTNIKYKENSLVNYFTNYNSCSDSSTKVYSQETKKGKFNIRGKISFGQSTITDYPSQSSTQFGLEFEYLLPFFNNTISIFSEPTYQSYNYENNSQVITGYNVSVPVPSTGETVTTPIYGTKEVRINYSTVEIPFAIRKYFSLNKNNKIFLNAGLNFNFNLEKEFFVKIDDNETNKAIESTTSYIIGLGYEFKNKISLELRYLPSRYLNSEGLDNSKFENISIKLGYNFL